MDFSLPGFSIHGIFQARVPEWVAISFSRGPSWLRVRAQVSRIAGRRFMLWATREAHSSSDFSSLNSNTVDLATWVYFSQFWRLEVRDQGSSKLMSAEGSPGLQTAVLSLYPHGMENRERASSCVSSSKGIDSMHGSGALVTSFPPKGPTPPSFRRLEFQHVNLQVGEQTFSLQWTPQDILKKLLAVEKRIKRM